MCGSMRKLDERGYTLLESIFQLLIMAAFIHLFVLFFLWKGPIEQQYSDYSSTEWELFSADLQQLLADVSEIRLMSNGKAIRLRRNQETIDIEQSGTVIRKRVGGDGHVPLFTGIHSATYTFDGKALTAFVTMQDGSVKVRGFAVGYYPE